MLRLAEQTLLPSLQETSCTLHARNITAMLTLSYKVCWKVGLEEVLVFKGVVQLPIGHAAALKPAVKDVLHALELPLALLAGNGEVVNEVAVQICDLHQCGHSSVQVLV